MTPVTASMTSQVMTSINTSMLGNSPLDIFARPVRTQALQGSVWSSRGISVAIKREDERDAVLGGNKWCKLAGHLALAREQNLQRLLSVGGIWSNHLHALAHAGQRFGFETVGVVRGDAAAKTSMLQEAAAAGMQFEFVSRESYRSRHDAQWSHAFVKKYGPCLYIPEGGAGEAAALGLNLLADEIAGQTSGSVILAVAVGSGTTLAGLRSVLPSRVTVWGFQAFADSTLQAGLQRKLAAVDPLSWRLFATQGMRAHRTLPNELTEFLQSFEDSEGIALDPVYTVRMLMRLQALIADGTVADGSKIIVLHSGGLQGRRGHDLVSSYVQAA